MVVQDVPGFAHGQAETLAVSEPVLAKSPDPGDNLVADQRVMGEFDPEKEILSTNLGGSTKRPATP